MTTTTIPKWIETLEQFHPCSEAVDWAKSQPSAAKAWKSCHRGDWMLWIIGRILGGERESDERKRLILCCCECARLSLPTYAKQYPSDDRVEKCIITTEMWARGDATTEEVRAARRAAAAAADAADAAYSAAADAAYAYVAAYAAAYAAAAAAAYAAADAAAYAAADAAAYAADAATRLSTLAECADIVRKHYPSSPFKAAKAMMKGPTE